MFNSTQKTIEMQINTWDIPYFRASNLNSYILKFDTTARIRLSDQNTTNNNPVRIRSISSRSPDAGIAVNAGSSRTPMSYSLRNPDANEARVRAHRTRRIEYSYSIESAEHYFFQCAFEMIVRGK